MFVSRWSSVSSNCVCESEMKDQRYYRFTTKSKCGKIIGISRSWYVTLIKENKECRLHLNQQLVHEI